ncbi:hypothetical protein ELI_11595 [Erythrobacter litoralis HTCC2594]|uniref:Uncharacterized protein n=2 Tax=Erythrobacter litoralis TaxID=39960 RepID=Q2N7D0_ERYLH|nr:hypothetical protein ELI_11595 [Erythrobacter litoralis HTCC2594]
MMATKYLPINYRHSAVSGEGSFEAALRECLNKAVNGNQKLSEAPTERVMILGQEGRELLLNEFADVTDGMAGIICEVVPGLLQPVLRRNEQQKQLTTNTLATLFELMEQEAGEKQDFIQGLCYFFVRHDHLLFVNVKGFRKRDVELFFEWLLQKLVGRSIALSAVLDRAETGDDIGRVSKFRIRGSSSNSKGVALNVGKEVKTRIGARTVAWSKAEAVVQAVVPAESFEKLMDSMGDKNRLVADVQWSVAGPRDKKVKEALQDVVTELADMDDGIVGIAGKDGEIKDGGVILGAKRPFDVAEEKNILIDFDHATDTLVSEYVRWVEDKKIVVE